MNIIFNNGDLEQCLKCNGVNYFLGYNQSGKSFILEQLKCGFSGNRKDFLVDGLIVGKGDYNVIYFDDTTDFNNEFKFTKNNYFRKLIYDNILNELNEEDILDKVNSIFNKIDEKVNTYLDLNLNNKTENKIKLDIEISDLNDIVDKFTNVYINNYILNEDNIPRSIKRKLIYELLLLKLDDNYNKNNIILIDNFDLYLDFSNTYKVIKLMENYSKTHLNCHFFLTTSSNIYELIPNKENIFHIANCKISKLNSFEDIIEKSLFEEAYINEKFKYKTFEEYKSKNSLLFINDIEKKYEEILQLHQHNIGKIYTNKIEKMESLIIYKNLFEYYFFSNLIKEINKY